MSETTTKRVLIVDDEKLVLATLCKMVSRFGHDTDQAGSAKEAIEKIESGTYDLIISDIRMQNDTGLDIARHINNSKKKIPIIIITGYATIKLAVEAMRLGAAHFLEKPIGLEELKKSINKVFDSPRQKAKSAETAQSEFLKSSEPEVLEIFQTAKLIAPTDAAVLITGASGTGKEVLARFVHQNSDASTGPFIAVNCGAIAENLVESELFGHVKGAFTGAIRSRKGLFEEANGGTLFLDEIGELPLATQVKLLRVIQERRFEPVGSNKSLKSTFRLITATNKDLEKEAERGNFRNDLLFRINVIHLHNPDLKNRKEDIVPLAHYFLKKFNRQHKFRVTGFSDEVLDVFKSHEWPGNIRELENSIERLSILTQSGVIEKKFLPSNLFKNAGKSKSMLEELRENYLANAKAQLTADEGKIDLAEKVRRFEAEIISRVLKQTGSNKKEAAKFLSINRTTLVEKVNRYPELVSFRRKAKSVRPKKKTK